MQKSVLYIFFFLQVHLLSAQVSEILIDGEFSDWQSLNPIHLDVLGDGRDNTDFRALFISNDPDYLFLHFDVGRTINLQDNNAIALYLDIDNDISTGLTVNGIGADIRYTFGDRDGRYQYSGQQSVDIDHEDIGLVGMPTVTSDQFEVGLKRRGIIGGQAYQLDNTIRIVLRDLRGGGDVLPNNGGVVYTMQDTPATPQSFRFEKEVDDFRVMSFNSEFDGFFDFETSAAQRRMVAAIDADIMGFQEIYDFTSADIVNVIKVLLDGPWYHAKRFPDVHCISRYPILDQASINGNGAFLLDLGDREVLLINVHFPCCENDLDRQEEVDNVMRFIRESKEGLSNIPLQEDTPIILLGDMNLVGFADQLHTLLKGDISNNGAYGPDFAPDWDGGELADVRPLVTGLPMAYTYEDESSSFGPGRLDFVLYTPSVLKVTNSFVLKTETLDPLVREEANLLSNDSQSSDHLPLVVDFGADFRVNADEVEEKTLFKVFPQPAKHTLFVKGTYESLQLFTLDGRSVQVSHGDRIDVSELEGGIYILLISNRDIDVFQKVVIGGR